MPDTTDGPGEFFGYVPQAKADIDELVRRAIAFNQLQELKATLRDAFHRLQSNPTLWGDPLYNTKLLGPEGSPVGTVYYKVHSFLILRYVYFPDSNKGLLLRVSALPNHPLAEQV